MKSRPAVVERLVGAACDGMMSRVPDAHAGELVSACFTLARRSARALLRLSDPDLREQTLGQLRSAWLVVLHEFEQERPH